ncbi:MAG: hypothetical protein L6R40_001949 [Gallowayella cf. fulva]|nr:MAG: hypothetical protein L6R40_001949 [Xanthomendoza cf. fulva]
MANKQGKMINYRMRVTLNDGRQMTGQMLAFDKHMNLVLADTEEFRRVKKKPTKGAQSAPGSTAPTTAMVETDEKRTLGLTIALPRQVDSLDFRLEDFQEAHHQGSREGVGHLEEDHRVLLLRRAFRAHHHKVSSLLRAFNHRRVAEDFPHQDSSRDKEVVKDLHLIRVIKLQHFWGPFSNFGIPIAAILDTQKDPELCVAPSPAALVMTSDVPSGTSPKPTTANALTRSQYLRPHDNYLLFACHFINFGAQSTQGFRFVKYWHYGGREEALKMKAQQGLQTGRTESKNALQQAEDKGKGIIQQGEAKLKEVQDKVIK